MSVLQENEENSLTGLEVKTSKSLGEIFVVKITALFFLKAHDIG